MNGGYSRTLARLAIASGIIIQKDSQPELTHGSSSVADRRRPTGLRGQGFYGHRRSEQSVARWCSGQA
jgi:hypothetical protein